MSLAFLIIHNRRFGLFFDVYNPPCTTAKASAHMMQVIRFPNNITDEMKNDM
jgi:hypothetical protein